MTDHDFAQRLARACDDSKLVPEYGKGRQVYLAKKLKVTQEAVRRWFTGESRPRVRIMAKLAALLEVDVAWLSLGIEPEMSKHEAKVMGRKSEGVVYMAAGFAMLTGAAVAMPADDDERRAYVDFYAIKEGQQVAVHCSLGRELADGVYEFLVPHEFRRCKVTGYVLQPHKFLHVIDLLPELVAKHKKSKGGGYAIALHAHGKTYITGRDTWPQLARLKAEEPYGQ